MALKIKNSEFYTPFYAQAIAAKVREKIREKLFIEVFLKGGRFSGKSYYVVEQILELSYLDPARSTIVIANHLTDHQERGMILFETIMSEIGILHEWRWKSKSTRPILWRVVNGYKQEIKFMSLKDLETAGFEPPIYQPTGKKGFYGMIWDDEMSKKTDNDVDADFSYIERLLDAIKTARNTFVRHLREEHQDKGMVIFHSLNPWGEGNPLVKEFHALLKDDIEKLKTKGYNLAYENEKSSYKICATTNYIVNTKIGEKALQAVWENRKDPRVLTMTYGATGKVQNSWFSNELNFMENRQKDIPTDSEFIPMNLSMDVGITSPSTLYLNGFDGRYMVKQDGDYYPTRGITKGEWSTKVENEDRDIPTKYKDMLWHIFRLSRRFPEMRDGFDLWVDGSAKETVELLKAYIQEIKQESPHFDIDNWLTIKLQMDKWKTEELRTNRRDRFGELVASYGWNVDLEECPLFFSQTRKIVSKQSEQKHDHWYDGIMYGVIALYKQIYRGIQIEALRKRYKEKED